MSNPRLKERIAVITGASRGIGRAVALLFAREGAHVILTARTTGALEELDDEIRAFGGSATLIPLDLTDGDKIDGLGPTLFERWDHVDILVGNAGVLGPLSPLGHISAEEWESVLTVNLTANWRLIRSLDPLLRRSDRGRAIFTTSGAARNCRAYWGPYSTTKAGLEALVKTYAHEIESTEVRAYLVNPGPIATGMRAKAFPGEDPDTLPKPDDVASTFLELACDAGHENGAVIDFAART